jgi:hypothetical protein
LSALSCQHADRASRCLNDALALLLHALMVQLDADVGDDQHDNDAEDADFQEDDDEGIDKDSDQGVDVDTDTDHGGSWHGIRIGGRSRMQSPVPKLNSFLAPVQTVTAIRSGAAIEGKGEDLHPQQHQRKSHGDTRPLPTTLGNKAAMLPFKGKRGGGSTAGCTRECMTTYCSIGEVLLARRRGVGAATGVANNDAVAESTQKARLAFRAALGIWQTLKTTASPSAQAVRVKRACSWDACRAPVSDLVVASEPALLS